VKTNSIVLCAVFVFGALAPSAGGSVITIRDATRRKVREAGAN